VTNLTANDADSPLEKSKDFRPPETMTALAWKRFRRHPGALVGSVVLLIIVISITFAFLSPYDPLKSDIANRYQPPSVQHPFGTDGLGRDLLTRVLYGGRVSLFVGVMVMVITLAIGVPVGAVAGFFGGWIDNILMRIIDAVLSLPTLLILILLSAILRSTDLPIVKSNNVMTIAVVIGLLSWPTVGRLVRAVFLTFRETEYVVAAQALGASDMRIMVGEILPNGFWHYAAHTKLGQPA
jgi:peptide/nickel transport system permease protein